MPPISGFVKSHSTSGGKVVDLGLIDPELVHNVRLIGHLGAARIIAAAGANFSIRTWLDGSIAEELGRGAIDGSDPEMPP